MDEDQDTGALGAIARQQAAKEPASRGGYGALQQVAYGDSGTPPIDLAQAPDLVDRMLPRGGRGARSDEDMRNDAFWGGITDPKGNPGQSLSLGIGEGLRAQTAQQNERDKLRAAYMPFVMQSILGRQQMTLAAAQASRDYVEKTTPRLMSYLSGLRANGAQPTRQDVARAILDFGGMNRIPHDMIASHLSGIPNNDKDVPQWLDQLILSSDPKAAIPTVGKNAADQPVAVSPTAATIKPLTPAGAAAPGAAGGAGADGQPNVNPTNVEIDMGKAGKDGILKQGEVLGTETQTLHDVVSRMTEVRKLQQEFQSGKYAKSASNLAAITKDLATRFGMDEAKAGELASKIVGSPPGSKEGLAASQAIQQFGLLESLAQLKDALGQNRMNRNEFLAAQEKINTLGQDPEALNKMYDFMRTRYGNYANRYNDFAQYAKKAGMTHSAYERDAAYHLGETKTLLSDNPSNTVGAGPVAEPSPVAALNRGPAGGAAPSQATGQAPAPGAKNEQSNARVAVKPEELSHYETGAILSPRGVPIVKDPSAKYGYRYAKKVK